MSERQFDVRGLNVFIGIPCGPSIPWQTAESILATSLALKDRGIAFDVRFVSGVAVIDMARNKVASEFLKSPANRFFMVDSDMQWSPDDFLTLLALSTKMEVVCGAYRTKQDEARYILKWDRGNLKLNEWGCLPIEGIGLGFTVVQRKVIEELAAKAPRVKWLFDLEPLPSLYRTGHTPQGDFEGEDTYFFRQVRELGYAVNLYPGLRLGHVGTKVYTGSIQDAMRPG